MPQRTIQTFVLATDENGRTIRVKAVETAFKGEKGMKAIGTVINKSGKAIAIFQVKPDVVGDPEKAKTYRERLRRTFRTVPIVLISLKDGRLVFEGDEKDIQLIKDDDMARYYWRGYQI